MAKCDEGYFCEVCGRDVHSIIDSDLYLRYVIGEISPEFLHTSPERHLRCNPTLSQFIDDDRFSRVQVDGEFSLANLDPDYVKLRVSQVTSGYRRLHWILEYNETHEQALAIVEYPLLLDSS